MDRHPTNNKIGESFEKQTPDDQVPEFIWDNIANELAKGSLPVESAEKIKTSFETGFDDEDLPDSLWEGVASQLEQKSSLNKIKSSFEGSYTKDVPKHIWENVEDQLEIDAVWQRIHKVLNRRTRKGYWREKSAQLGIAILVVLWLRGCGIGEELINPIAYQSEPSTTVEYVKTTPANSEGSSTYSNSIEEAEQDKETPIAGSKVNLSSKQTPWNQQESTTKQTLRANKAPQIVTKRKPTSTIGETITGLKPIAVNEEEGQGANQVVNTTLAIDKRKSDDALLQQPSWQSNNNTPVSTGFIPVTLPNTNNTTQHLQGANVITTTPSIHSLMPSSKELIFQKVPNHEINPIVVKPMIADSGIYELSSFQIQSLTPSKRHTLRFETGMNTKIGTSLLLGSATNRAMETTSMLKTKVRTALSVGVVLACHLTANDAVIIGAYPFSSNQQYFGGYTSEGRYYHKEIKLTYFDFTIGYQRTLFHYNDFGMIPSSMYARVGYGFGYLSKGEEVLNGVAAELGSSYNKINHSLGLAIGNTHRINRFVIDYGLSANIGVSSILNQNSLGTTTEYTNLMNMGGYLGLRYVL
ncbi:hypothetical protein [Aureispira anguillae]|uniref:Outer membrane protein beta-barrel domain-containing protein n=1 Tax=Aureispira anguillae TaxID=2864201 RepID=A0A915YIT7_9BACT|nr:hypothetical protein [Aureispira anguillae]BDS13964.1 hypothetical protein AsAng_0047270 [Aureispira anguillae]